MHFLIRPRFKKRINNIIIVFLFIVISVLPNELFAEDKIFNSIVIEGNSRIATDTIIEIADVSVGVPYTQQKINNILQKLNSSKFFKSVRIDLNNNTLKIAVLERPIIQNIYFEGNKLIKNETLENIITSNSRNTLFKSQIESDAEKIFSYYCLIGYN